MVIMSEKLASMMGLRRKELLEVRAVVTAANGELIPCLVCFPLKLSIPDGRGGHRESRQFSYVVSKSVGLIVRQDGLINLGLLPEGSPTRSQFLMLGRDTMWAKWVAN